jgi:hypothetical protein
MIQNGLLTIGAAAFLGLTAVVTAANAADRKVKAAAAPAAPAVTVERVEDCSAFYDPYENRGFGWGSGPGRAFGFGTFEGALPDYPMNSFPNWYGQCVNWGHYSATGSAAR